MGQHSPPRTMPGIWLEFIGHTSGMWSGTQDEEGRCRSRNDLVHTAQVLGTAGGFASSHVGLYRERLCMRCGRSPKAVILTRMIFPSPTLNVG